MKLKAVTLQVAFTVCGPAMLNVPSAALHCVVSTLGVRQLSYGNFSVKPESVAVVALVGTSVHGKFNGPEIPHSALPVNVAPVIVALEPSAATWPLSVIVHGTGVNTSSFTAVAIEPEAVNAAPAGAKVAAPAMDETVPRVNNIEPRRAVFLRLCIVMFPRQ